MTNKEKTDYLLLDIRELETLVAGMRNAEVYPVSFFSQTFSLAHKILNDLHTLETAQIAMLRQQMEDHTALIQSIPCPIAAPMPEPIRPEPAKEPVILPPPAPIVVEVKVEEAKPIIQEPKPVQPITPTPIEVPIAAPEPKGTSGLFLNDLLEKKNFSDFRKAFSLNDRFRFRRELFGGSEERMNKAVAELNDIHTYEDSVTYLHHELKWNIEDEAVADFLKLLEKRFL